MLRAKFCLDFCLLLRELHDTSGLWARGSVYYGNAS